MSENKGVEHSLAGWIKRAVKSNITKGLCSWILVIKVYVQPVNQKIEAWLYSTGKKKSSSQLYLFMRKLEWYKDPQLPLIMNHRKFTGFTYYPGWRYSFSVIKQLPRTHESLVLILNTGWGEGGTPNQTVKPNRQRKAEEGKGRRIVEDNLSITI